MMESNEEDYFCNEVIHTQQQFLKYPHIDLDESKIRIVLLELRNGPSKELLTHPVKRNAAVSILMGVLNSTGASTEVPQ